jgi:hypothetical protein
MHRGSFVIIVVLLFAAPSNVARAELIVVESKDVTSKDVPVKFTLERTSWKYDSLVVWGKVQNGGTRKYGFVKVLITALDKDKKFLGRIEVFCDPHSLDKGQVGYITQAILDTEERRPAAIEVKVLGDPQD